MNALRSSALDSVVGVSSLRGYNGRSRSGLGGLSNIGLADGDAKSGFQNNYGNRIAKSYDMQRQTHVLVSKKKKKSKCSSHLSKAL